MSTKKKSQFYVDCVVAQRLKGSSEKEAKLACIPIEKAKHSAKKMGK